jgi:GNAT superfamily N-acetyltransferase
MRIVPVSGLDPAQDELFRAWAGVYEASDREVFGDDHAAWTADQLRELERSTDRRRLAWAALDGHVAVGALGLVLPLHDNRAMAVVNLAVHPSARRRGVGSGLLAHAEAQAREQGRTVLVAETQWPVGGRDTGGEDFAAPHGYAAAQTVLRSSLPLRDLSAPAARARLEQLVGNGTDGYVVRTFVAGIPDDWLAARAELSRAMSTDVPLGDLQLEEEAWDDARVRAEYARIEAMGRTVVDTFAVHEPTGEVAGYTEVQVSREEPEVAYQQDTLVRRAHRGHALGLRLKAANTLRLQEVSAGTRVVRTWNADDNTHMLAVNRQLGYRHDGYLREWQKVLA